VSTDQIGEQVKLLDGPAAASQGGTSLMRPRIRREPALKEAWEPISTLEGPERASRNPVVGSIGPAAPAGGGAGPAPGNEMVDRDCAVARGGGLP
jgi:hypothetical protein